MVLVDALLLGQVQGVLVLLLEIFVGLASFTGCLVGEAADFIGCDIFGEASLFVGCDLFVASSSSRRPCRSASAICSGRFATTICFVSFPSWAS